jgi:hypothetical protein
MKMEYTAEVLRGWPNEGARERTEIVSQGAILVNGDVVTLQADGTVNKVSSTKTKRAGLVIRGNGDSGSAANAQGRYATPQAITSITATWAGGLLTVTHTAHGFATGNAVIIAASAGSGTYANYAGTWTIAVVDANTYTIAIATNSGTITTGTAQLTGVSNSGKAVVLWGNAIVRVSNFTAGSWAPGKPVTAVSGKYALATGQGNADGTYTVTATNTIDPEVGFCLSVQGTSATQTAHVVISLF